MKNVLTKRRDGYWKVDTHLIVSSSSHRHRQVQVHRRSPPQVLANCAGLPKANERTRRPGRVELQGDRDLNRLKIEWIHLGFLH